MGQPLAVSTASIVSVFVDCQRCQRLKSMPHILLHFFQFSFVADYRQRQAAISSVRR